MLSGMDVRRKPRQRGTFREGAALKPRACRHVPRPRPPSASYHNLVEYGLGYQDAAKERL